MADISFHSILTSFLMSSPEMNASGSLESEVCRLSGILVKSSPMTIADFTLQHSVEIEGQSAPVSDLDQHTYFVDLLSFRWRLDIGSWIERLNDQGGVKAICPAFIITRETDLPVEIDVIPPDVRSESDISKLTKQKIATCRDDLLKRKAQKARETFKVEKIDCSKIDCIDDAENNLKLGLSILDLINTESDKQSPDARKEAEVKSFTRERSRSKSSSKNNHRSVISLSSDEEEKENEKVPPAVVKKKGRPKKQAKQRAEACY